MANEAADILQCGPRYLSDYPRSMADGGLIGCQRGARWLEWLATGQAWRTMVAGWKWTACAIPRVVNFRCIVNANPSNASSVNGTSQPQPLPPPLHVGLQHLRAGWSLWRHQELSDFQQRSHTAILQLDSTVKVDPVLESDMPTCKATVRGVTGVKWTSTVDVSQATSEWPFA